MNPYEVLGVSRLATKEEIKEAYLRMAKKYHPDKHHDSPLQDLAEEKMKQVNWAYNILSDEYRRQEFDQSSNESSRAAASSDDKLVHIMSCISMRKFADALAAIERCIDECGISAQMVYLRGHVYQEMSMLNRALQDYDAALVLNPLYVECMLEAAELCIRIKDYRKGVGLLERSLSVTGEVPNVMIGLAICYDEVGRKSEAKALYERVEAIDPNNALLLERKKVWKVGGVYVSKKSVAATAGCVVLAVIQSVFDCV